MEYLSTEHLFDVTEKTLLVVLRRPPTLAMVATLEARVKSAARANAAPMAYLHVVLDVPSTGKVEEPIRQALMGMAKRSMQHTDCAAMVLLRSGFPGAAMRAMVSGALLLVRPTVPVRIFGEVNSAALWISSVSAEKGTRRDAAALRARVLEMQDLLLRDYVP